MKARGNITKYLPFTRIHKNFTVIDNYRMSPDVLPRSMIFIKISLTLLPKFCGLYKRNSKISQCSTTLKKKIIRNKNE